MERAKLIACSIGFAVSFLVTPAQAIDGDQFFSMCSNREDANTDGFCTGYVFAVAEALDGLSEKSVCFHSESPVGLLGTVMAYLNEQPGLINTSSGALVVSALEESYPCQ